MKRVTAETINEVIELSKLLGEFGQIKRAVLMPDGEPESDSHHSFSLALVAFELASQHAPTLDLQKILLYSLVHDLSEVITGDVVTLTSSAEELRKKAEADTAATAEIIARLGTAPHIAKSVQDYEDKADDEALFVYWVDKMITIPTHFYDRGANLRKQGVQDQHDIRQWYERTLEKLERVGRKPHDSAISVLELAYQKMHDELLGT
jgi:putative hydrolase of HD superfamily